jgi:hypothetical protein
MGSAARATAGIAGEAAAGLRRITREAEALRDAARLRSEGRRVSDLARRAKGLRVIRVSTVQYFRTSEITVLRKC